MVENVKILTLLLVYSSLVLHSVACHSLCDLVVKESLCLELSSPPLFPFIFSVVLVLVWRLIKWLATVPEHELRIMDTDDT